MGDLLIAGGLVVDGSGAPGRTLDVRVRNGRIAEMAPHLSPAGERVIDAAGAVVAPGFIDSHTHFDATIYWDPMCDPMPQHGVTTVVIGNCSLGLAPIRPEDRAAQVDVFSYIEDLPLEVMNAAIPWGWESFGGYAEALSQRRLGVNLAAFVGHSQIRIGVMGEAAWERAATPEEIAAMAAELDRALAAGAIGLSFSLYDKDRQGRWVPSCLADDAELDALFAVLARRGAVFQFVPCGDTTDIILEQLERVGGVLGRHGVTGLYNIVVHVGAEPSRSQRIIACLEALHARGVRLFAMASPRPFELSIGFGETICFIAVPAWNELVQASLDEKRRLVADPAWRARARADADICPSVLFPFERPDTLRIREVAGPAQQAWAGRTLQDLIAARGGHVSDVLADWIAENDFAATFVYAIANTDDREVAALLKNPVTFVSGSDAGAHLQMFCAAGDSTLLLTRFVRDRGDMTLEAAVHALTGRQAELLRLGDRGVLAPGKAADITVFALNELNYGPEVAVSDLPGGRPRLTRGPGGYRYTVVGGVVVQEAGRATGELPARWLGRAGA
jgi:N-acyl-D-aspartate/D-glutamate deacylase